MAKRFIDTEIFRDAWFMNLSVNAKLLYIYLITNCDHAGIIEINWKLVEVQTGIKQLAKSYVTLMKDFDNRIIKVKNGYYFIPRFISFQYPNFPNSKVRQQSSAINRLKEFNLFDEKNLTLSKDLAKSYEYDNVNEHDNEHEYYIKKTEKKSSLLKNSGITVENIQDAFLKTDDLKNADPKYYFNSMMDWSESKSEMRKDWVATARTFARRDLNDGKLKMKQTHGNRLIEF